MKRYRGQKAGERIRRTYDALLADWGVPVETLTVQTRYGATRVNAAGDPSAPALLLLHGVGDDSALMWVYNARELSARMRLYAVDTIGGPGMSEPGEAYAGKCDDALWLDDVLDGLGIGAADIAGVSHGGYLAQLYAVKRPERTRKIACLAAAAAAGGGNGSPMKTMLRIFMPEALFPTRGNAIRLLRKLSGENAGAFTDNETVLNHFTALLSGYNNMAMAPHTVERFSEAQIDGIRDKSLFLAGDRDPFMLLGGKEAIVSRGLNARFYPTAGHGLNHELPGEIDAALLEWFCN